MQQVDWDGCEGELECATIDVPLDHDDPLGETITIAMARRVADDASRRIGTMLINPGGPGGSGIDLLQSAEFFFPDDVLERFDVVGFDPRGVGDSTAIDCGDDFDAYFAIDPSPDDDAERQAIIEAAREYAADCSELSARLLPHVDTESAARDMDIIRAALGEEQLTYTGFSYGTYLGAQYADLFPRRVRAMVLDGGVDPTLTYDAASRTQAAGFERALQAFLDDCASNESCAFYSDGDPFAAYDELMREIDMAPLDANDRDVGPGEATLAVVAALYEREYGWPALALALDAARDGDGSILLELSDAYTRRRPDGSYGNLFEANAAVNCLDTPAPRDLQYYDELARSLAELAPRLGSAAGYLGVQCAFWPVPPANEPHAFTAPGAPPIVVIGTTGDPATPYAWSEALAGQLESGVLLTWEGEGHTALGKSECIGDAVSAYLIELRAPAAGVRCE